MSETRREQLERELRELAETERAAAGTVDAGSGDQCPNCGGTFTRAPRPAILHDGPNDPNGAKAEKRQEQRDKLDAERGELQRCSGCGYERRAKDRIVEAAAK
jgi:hypothetical protein